MTAMVERLRKPAVMVLVGVCALAVATPTAAAEPVEPADVHVIGIDPLSIDDLGAIREVYAAPAATRRSAADPTADARCGDPAPAAVPDGEPIVVRMPPAAPFTVGEIPASSWRNPPVADPTWRMNYQGLMWVKPLARRAAQDGQLQSLNALVRQAISFHTDNPDPGTNAYGWDEGTALRRLETLNCLYALTRDDDLRTSMGKNVAVLTGTRYYGPPNHAVHNHGLMANLQMIRAAELLGDQPAWRSKAISRIVAEAPLAFSRLGISYEQSSAYQAGNASLWEQAAVALENTSGQSANAAKVRATVNLAWRAYSFMTEPDGKISQIGDSDEIVGRPLDLRLNRGLLDPQAGWAIGRWSWTDPNSPHYTVRFGPVRRAHGHEDRAGGVTWSVKGVRVLVGPGRYSYDKNNMYAKYQIRPDGQNVAIPNGGTVRGGTSTITSSYKPTSHVFTVKDTVYGRNHTRGVTVNSDIPRLVVSDQFTGVAKWRQHWHLDPDWVKSSGSVGGSTMVFRHPPTGRLLTVTTTGTIVSALRGSNDPRGPYGWHFPRFQTLEAAYQIMVDNKSTWTVTTFRVS